MNSLSWMLYAAEVGASLDNALFGIALTTAIAAGAGLTIAGIIAHTEGEPTDWIWPWGKRVLWIIAPCAIAAALIPSSTTIYAIAASEVGETVLDSETGGKAVEALDAWLDRQIAGETPDAR